MDINSFVFESESRYISSDAPCALDLVCENENTNRKICTQISGLRDQAKHAQQTSGLRDSSSKRKKTCSVQIKDTSLDCGINCGNQNNVWKTLCPWSLLENEIYLYKKNPSERLLENLLKTLKEISINFDFWAELVMVAFLLPKKHENCKERKNCNAKSMQDFNHNMLDYIDTEIASESIQNFIYLPEDPKAQPDQKRDGECLENSCLSIQRKFNDYLSNNLDKVYNTNAILAIPQSDKKLTSNQTNLDSVGESDYAQMYIMMLGKYQRALNLISSLENENERLYELVEEKRS